MWWRYHASRVRHRKLALPRERQALRDPVILGKVTQAFRGAIFGQGRSMTYRSPGMGVGTKRGDFSSFSLAGGVLAKMTFRGRRPVN